MRLRILSILALGALLAGTASAAQASGARPSLGGRGTAVKIAAPNAPDLTTLYDQNDNDSGVGITSQNFETSLDAYDGQGADDFVVPAGIKKWKVKKVNVTGVYYNGSGPAVSENIFFYKDAGGLPGTLKSTQTVVGTDNGLGSFSILLTTPVALKPGHYWVSVQANMDFGVGGQWGWEGRTVQGGLDPAAWQNPGDGFGTGCTSWGVEVTCLGDFGQGPDFMFSLQGKVIPL